MSQEKLVKTVKASSYKSDPKIREHIEQDKNKNIMINNASRKEFSDDEALQLANDYLDIRGNKKRAQEAQLNFMEVRNCINYLCDNKKYETLTKFMDLIIDTDVSYVITNMFFLSIGLKPEQKNYFFETRPNYFEKMIKREKENDDPNYELLKMCLTDENADKFDKLI